MNPLLRFFSYHQPRRIRVIENTLRSHRTVATLFWANQYGIINWLGAYRSLTRPEYDQLIDELVSGGLLIIDNQLQGKLTEKGAATFIANEQASYQPAFYDWYWLANTHRVLQRILLAVQVVSEYAHQQVKYSPIAVPRQEMMAVKQWFRQNHDKLVPNLYRDLERFGKALASEDQRLADDFFSMMVGYQHPGWTIEQAAAALKINKREIQYLRHDELLAISAYARNFPGPLHHLLMPLLNLDPLSRSTAATLNAYQHGQDIAQIAKQRRLKENTVREHLLEAAILVPTKVEWDRLLPVNKREQLAQKYQGTPADWQYDEQYSSFYEYRLYQIYQGAVHGK